MSIIRLKQDNYINTKYLTKVELIKKDESSFPHITFYLKNDYYLNIDFIKIKFKTDEEMYSFAQSFDNVVNAISLK